MSDTTRAVKVSNERIRPTADKLGQTYFTCLLMLKLAAAEDWSRLFATFNEKDLLPDGSAEDGRNQVTPESIKALLVAMQSFVDFMDANDGQLRDLVLAVAVNPERL